MSYPKPTQLNMGRVAEGGPGYLGPIASAPSFGGVRVLSYIPYYFRANRGGKGHMRVALKILEGVYPS